MALITGDGKALSTGPVPAIFPGPLLPNVLSGRSPPRRPSELLALADELGLLADITYAPNDMVADAPDTVVTITVDGTTYVHRAYALGIDDEHGSGSRQPHGVRRRDDRPAGDGRRRPARTGGAVRRRRST